MNQVPAEHCHMIGVVWNRTWLAMWNSIRLQVYVNLFIWIDYKFIVKENWTLGKNIM